MSAAGCKMPAKGRPVWRTIDFWENVRKIWRDDRRYFGHNTPTMSIDDIHIQQEVKEGMSPRICICCGQPMSIGGKALSRNPNICASCSSILDGMGEWKNEEVKKPSNKPATPSLKPKSREATSKGA